MAAKLAIVWRPRVEPLVPVAVLGLGPIARALGRTLRDRAELRDVAKVVAGSELLCVLAPTERLPWIDGVMYLGEAAPGFFMPTTVEPELAIELVARACLVHGHPTPLALVPEPGLIVPLGQARQVERERLAAWLGEPNEVRA